MLAAVMLMMILLHQLRQPGTTVEFFYRLHDLVSAPLGDEHDPNVVVEPASQQDGDADDEVAG